MNHLQIGDTVQNSKQLSVVRWIGEIEDMSMIGLESLNLTLPGYSDGTCPFDDNRYFECPRGHGYYILESGFNKSYKILPTKKTAGKGNNSDEEFGSAEQSLSSSPADAANFPQPILSKLPPTPAQIQHHVDNTSGNSSSRGVLSRINAEREQRQTSTLSPSKSKENSFDQTSSRTYQPDNYRSQTFDRQDEPELTDDDSEDDTKTNARSPQTRTVSKKHPPVDDVPIFGQEYFLDDWTLGRLKKYVENEINSDGQFCLNVVEDQCIIQSLIHSQITECLSVVPASPPFDVRIELIKLYNHVKTIFPSRSISLYGNDYLLLAILCSNNNCAYIRTSNGWIFSDEEGDQGKGVPVDEVSQMIENTNFDAQYHSEQCRHLLKDAAYLYYKLVV